MGIQLDKAIRFLRTKKYTFEELNKSDPKLRRQKDFVLAAIEIDPRLLKVNKAFCDNEEVVRTAVSQDGTSLAYASDRLKNDKQTVIYAVLNSLSAAKHAGNELKADVKFWAALSEVEHCVIYYLSPSVEKEVLDILKTYDGNEEELINEQLGEYDIPQKTIINLNDLEDDEENS